MDRASIWLLFFGLIILTIIFVVIGFSIYQVVIEWDKYF